MTNKISCRWKQLNFFLTVCLYPFGVHGMDSEKTHTPVIRVLIEQNYTSGSFEVEKDKNALFTPPQRPRKASPQSVLSLKEDAPNPPNYETVLKRIKKGEDGRTRVLETTQWPYSFHAQLAITYPYHTGKGSGVFVGPHHVLTAGHCIHGSVTDWATKILVRPALNEDEAPFGEILVTRIYTFKSWVEKSDPLYDMALLVLEESIGLETGWSGLLTESDHILMDEEIHVTGYPDDKGAKQLWTMAHKIKKTEPEKFFYDIDTFVGQSGCSIWIQKYKNPYTIGVHAYGEDPQYEGNSGTRLSQDKFKTVVDIIAKTYTIQKANANTSSFISEEEPWIALPKQLLTDEEEAIFEDLFGMRDGYVLGPSASGGYGDTTFERLFNKRGINIEDAKYKKRGTSKAKKLRSFWMQEKNPKIMGEILQAILKKFREIKKDQLQDEELKAKYKEAKKIVMRLLSPGKRMANQPDEVEKKTKKVKSSEATE